ncbi:MAG: hypothetical protein AB8B87_18015 [Granulosicoccus sp.]
MIKRLRHGRCSLMIRCVMLCVASIPTGFAFADTPSDVLERLAVPKGLLVQTVTSDSVHNGRPLAVATLQATQTVDSVIAFYRRYWASHDGDEQPGFVESQLSDWQLISRFHNGINIVIQLKADEQNSTSGFISVMAVDAPSIVDDHGAFSNLISLSSHQSVDGVDISSMRVYAASSSVAQTYRIYREKMVSRGWQVLSGSKVDGSWVMILARDQARLEISIVPSREYGSVLVAHKVTSN